MTKYEEWVVVEKQRLIVAGMDHPFMKAAFEELTRKSKELRKQWAKGTRR